MKLFAFTVTLFVLVSAYKHIELSARIHVLESRPPLIITPETQPIPASPTPRPLSFRF